MDNLKIEEIWAEAKNLLKAETTEITFQTWIERIVVESINDNNIILSVETPFHRDTLQNRYLELIKNTDLIMYNPYRGWSDSSNIWNVKLNNH